MSLTPEAIKTLSGVTTATITTVLLKKGLRNVWMRGARPLRPGQKRLVGPAFTLRFVPAREDLATPEILVVTDFDPDRDRGHAGRLHRRGRCHGYYRCRHLRRYSLRAHGQARGGRLVTDGVVRDLEGVLGTNLPVWCDGYAAPPSVAGLTFVGWGEPIGCGGVAIFPNDVIVADQDGAVVIPQAFLDLVLAEGAEQERMEAWIVDEVKAGAVLPGLYPMNAETKARYAASKK